MSEVKEFSLKLLVDNKRGIVLFAEATKSLCDSLYDVLSDPDTLFSLMRQQGRQETALANLCKSIQNLNLAPPPASDKIYTCSNSHDNGPFHYSDSQRAKCPTCHSNMKKKVEYVAPPPPKTIGVMQVVVYIITDDLEIKPMLGVSGMHLMMRLYAKELDVSALEEKLVHLNFDEVVKLVDASMHSKTVLTDFFLKAHQQEEAKPVASVPRDDILMSMYI